MQGRWDGLDCGGSCWKRDTGKGERDRREIWIPICLDRILLINNLLIPLLLSYRPSNNNNRLFIFYFERGSSSIFENFINSASFLPAEKSGREQMESEGKLEDARDAISILVIPLMDIQFRVSSLDDSLTVKDRVGHRPLGFEKLDRNGSTGKGREEIFEKKWKNLKDRLLHVSIIYPKNYPIFFSRIFSPLLARCSKIIDKRNNETRWLKLVATYVTNEWDRNRNCSASIPTLLIHLLIYRLYHCPNGL